FNHDRLAAWRGRTVGIVFQFFQLLPTLTVIENVMLPMDFAGHLPASRRPARALELLRRVAVPEQADKLPAALSGGQQQRVAIAPGMFEIGALLYKYAVLQPVLTTMYARTHPASATLTTDAVDDTLVEAVRRVPGVATAEARPVILARVRIGEDRWVPAVLFV